VSREKTTSGSVAVFVKTPGLSPIKTRLARTLGGAAGQEWAESWYLLAARAVAGVAEAALAGRGVEIYWAVAETKGLESPCWQDRPRFAQVEPGDSETGLGLRMAGVHNRLTDRHGWCLLLGADAPQLDGRHLVQAADWLDEDSPAQVFGRATDGGFWTYGANRASEAERWSRVTYSRPDTAEKFHEAMASCRPWLELPRLTDLDHAADLESLRAELRALPRPDRLQKELLAMMESAGDTQEYIQTHA